MEPQKPVIQRPVSAKNETEIKTYLLAVVTRSLYLLYLTRKILSYRIINVLAASGWLNFFSFFFFCKQICVVQAYVFMHVYVCVDMHVQVCMHICTHAGRGQRLVSVSSLVALPLDIDPDLENSASVASSLAPESSVSNSQVLRGSPSLSDIYMGAGGTGSCPHPPGAITPLSCLLSPKFCISSLGGIYKTVS